MQAKRDYSKPKNPGIRKRSSRKELSSAEEIAWRREAILFKEDKLLESRQTYFHYKDILLQEAKNILDENKGCLP